MIKLKLEFASEILKCFVLLSIFIEFVIAIFRKQAEINDCIFGGRLIQDSSYDCYSSLRSYCTDDNFAALFLKRVTFDDERSCLFLEVDDFKFQLFVGKEELLDICKGFVHLLVLVQVIAVVEDEGGLGEAVSELVDVEQQRTSCGETGLQSDLGHVKSLSIAQLLYDYKLLNKHRIRKECLYARNLIYKETVRPSL